MPTNHGYEFEPKMGAGKYLTLKAKGDLIDIRIASNPLHKTIHWTTNEETGSPQQVDHEGETCQYCDKAAAIEEPQAAKRASAKEVFAWIVLDLNDDSKPKIFKGGTSIYLAIKGLSESKAWGDPQGYNIEIQRTEEKPQFYKVIPLPDKSEITAAERKSIKEANLNLEEEIGGGEPTNTFGKDEDADPEEIVKEMDGKID